MLLIIAEVKSPTEIVVLGGVIEENSHLRDDEHVGHHLDPELSLVKLVLD